MLKLMVVSRVGCETVPTVSDGVGLGKIGLDWTGLDWVGTQQKIRPQHNFQTNKNKHSRNKNKKTETKTIFPETKTKLTASA